MEPPGTVDMQPISNDAHLPALENRVRRAVLSLEGSALALRLGVIPAVLLTTLVLAFVTSESRLALVFVSGTIVVGSLMLESAFAGLATLIRLGAARAEAAERLDRRVAEGIDRIAAALASAQLTSSHAPRPLDDQKAEMRLAIQEQRWDDASRLVRDFVQANADHASAAGLVEGLAAAKHGAAEALQAKLEAARSVNDPERVLELRDELKPLLDSAALRILDRELAKWLILVIHRRLRSGTIRADVAQLAARVAGSLDDTPEGASLRASLPTLRRAVGLCPRCAQPYTGIADACPACLAGLIRPVDLAAPDDSPEKNEDSQSSPSAQLDGIPDVG